MIKETLRAHGDRHLEIKRRVSFDSPEKYLKYLVETWFFFPTTLQVNRWSFPPQTFPQYLKTYIRLRPPSENVAGLIKSGSALDEIERLLDRLASEKASDSGLFEDYEKKLKLFCMTYRRAIRLAARDIMRPNRTSKERLERTTAYRDLIEVLLRRYRGLRDRNQVISRYLRSPAFQYCDEYVSIITTHYCFKLLGHLPEGEDKERFRAFWRGEMAYRDANHHESIAISGQDNEIALYRWSVLKKYVNAPLFLEQRRKSGQTLAFHLITSLAAAFAMIFATAVAFYWQTRHGALSTPLFLALVIGYIFKDKMKEVSREKMFSSFRRWLPDRRMVIYKDIDRPIGSSEEAFSFVDEGKLPEPIKAIRKKSHLVDIHNSFRSEDILYYSKAISLENLDNMFFSQKRSIVDITRLDISPFLRHADDICEELPTLDAEDIAREDKAYHINIIRRITTNDRQHEVSIERMRVVITHHGIKRIEEVLSGEVDILANRAAAPRTTASGDEQLAEMPIM